MATETNISSRIPVGNMENYNDENSTYSTKPTILKIGDYVVELRLPSESEDCDLEKERLQVNVTSKQGDEYYADFVTLRYLQGLMDENLVELGRGNYIPGRGIIILKDLTKATVSDTLDDIILNWETRLKFCFRENN